jgi:hypothetical protein
MNALWAVKIRYLCGVGGDKEVNEPFLSDFFKVFFCKLIIGLELLLMFICSRCNVDKVLI